MGAVYRVWDLKRNAPLAMKVLHAELAEDPSVFNRFQREARALEKLTHPNIVPFYGLFHLDDVVFILERFIDGPTLRDVLRQNKGQPVPLPQALPYIKAVSAALGYAHANGVIHCDVKPGNVMIDRGGTIYLTDFGVARHTESTTTTIGSAGTPAYMAPEQVRGDSVTPATDIYEIGVLLFELLTGQRPFKGTEPGSGSEDLTIAERTRYAHLHLMPPDPQSLNPEITPELARVILTALSKNPIQRFESTQEFFLALCDAAHVSPAEIPDRAPLGDTALLHSIKPIEPAEEVPPSWMNTPPRRRRTPPPSGVFGSGGLLKQLSQVSGLSRSVLMALFGATALGLLIIVAGVGLISALQRSPQATTAPPTTPALQSGLPSEAAPASPTVPSGTSIPSPSDTPSPTPTATLPPLIPGSTPQGQIVFTCQVSGRAEKNDICVMNVDGSQYRQLTFNADNHYPSFAPDNLSAVFISDASGIEDIFEVNMQGNIARITLGDGPWSAPHISPDGRLILAARLVNQHWELWTMGRDGSDKRYIYTSPTGQGAWDPVWSPDGTQIVFASDMYGSAQLFTINADGFELAQVSQLEELRGRNDWSPDGIYIATYAGLPWEREIYLMSPDGSNLRAITYGGNNLAPSFSPDGQWIVFTSYRDNYRKEWGCEVYIMTVAGTDIRRLTENGYCDWQPRWSR
jgi:serine/threonine protein kinase